MKQLSEVLESLDRDDIIKTTTYCYPYHVSEGYTSRYTELYDKYGIQLSVEVATFYAYFERGLHSDLYPYIVIHTSTDTLREKANKISVENTVQQIMDALGWSEVIYDNEAFFRSMCLFTKLNKVLQYESRNA